MDELLAQFLIEGPELTQQGAEALMALERDPDDRAMLDDAFRAFHTLKGSVGLFDLPAMATTLHAAEDLLGAVRAGLRTLDAAAIDALLAVLTQSDQWLASIESDGRLDEGSLETARRLSDQLTTGGRLSHQATPEEFPAWALDLRRRLPDGGALVAIRYRPAAGSYFSGDDPLALIRSVPGLRDLTLGLTEAAETAEAYNPFQCRLVLHALADGSMAEIAPVFRFVPDQVELVPLPAMVQAADQAGPQARAAIRTLRVDAARVESLAAMVHDLVAAKTALATLARQAAAGASVSELSRSLAAQSDGLDRLVGQMHQQVMALRMTSVAPILRRFPRLVRELAGALERDVDLIVNDNGVEADKSAIEGLFEPLTHLIRNAVDHGVEDPKVRAARGKPRKATLQLTAQVADSRLLLTLQDDGGGIDPAAIRAAVLAKGLMDADKLEKLSDADAVNLIFLPGLSTARRVSSISGRGVGMDAVKAAIHRLGGRLSVASEVGVGTSVELDLPLNLSLTKVIVVRSGAETYGVPIEQVVETVRAPAASISTIKAGRAFTWRDRAIPLLPLSGLVGGAAEAPKDEHRVLVLRAGANIVGVSVDAIEERLDVAVQPLEGLLADLRGVTGTTLMGDGRVLIILEPEALIG